jgi:hypothetical protein
MQTNRGVALSDCRCAQARTRFTPRQRFAKAKLRLSIKAFHAVRIFAQLRGGVRIARRVAEVARIEQSEIRDRAVRPAPDFVSLNPGYAYFLGTLASRLMISPASKPIASAHSIISTTSTSFWPVST